jgi:uncharacterized protein YecE (DUF72 family)
MRKGNFYSGTSGLVLPVKNKQAYPPQFQDKSRLTYYATLFSSLEVNSSFYKLPMERTVIKWAGEAPDGFQFTFKLWQGITHNKGLVYDPQDIERFIQVINRIGDKKGCLLVQFPPSFGIDAYLLEKLLADLQQTDSQQAWKVAIEFRNRSWYQDEVYELLNRYNAAIVLHDLPASATPMQIGEAGFAYLRFHGPAGGYRGSYADDFLYEYAQYINEWLADGKDVYVYFNNTMGDAVKNLMTLNSFIV